MKIKFLFAPLFIFTIAFLSQSAVAQCPWNRVNCEHGCGRFLDANINGFCDLSEVKTIDTTKVKTTVNKEVEVVKKVKEVKECNSKQPDRCDGCKQDKCTHSESEATSEEDEFKSMDAEVDTTAVSKAELETATSEKKKPYSLILISLVTFGLYAFTWLLVKLKKLKLSMHRKIWNLILLCTFLVSCLFGFFLVIQLNYDFVIDWYRTVLYWHVQVGIAMTIIAVFHAIWHTKYYINMFKQKNK